MANKLHVVIPQKDGLYVVTGRNGESSIMNWTNKDQFGHLTYCVYEWRDIEESNSTIAKRLMDEIAHCNGMVNRWEPMVYPEEHVKKITPLANTFFNHHPHLYNDNDILNICDGEYNENQELYGDLEGYENLSQALNDFFNEQ